MIRFKFIIETRCKRYWKTKQMMGTPLIIMEKPSVALKKLVAGFTCWLVRLGKRIRVSVASHPNCSLIILGTSNFF